MLTCTIWRIARNLIFLSFSVPPRVTPFDFEDNPLHSGDYAQLNCLVAVGDLPLNIDWKLNGQSVDNYAEITISKVGKGVHY